MMKVVLSKLLRIACLLVVFAVIHTAFVNSAYAQKEAIKRTSSGVYYLEHLPKNYRSSNEKFPVMIFLHGQGERGNGSGAIKKITKWGPPRRIEEGDDMTFKVNGKSFSLVVISPQLRTNQSNWSPGAVDDIINYVLRNYKVDPDRLYLTGLSLGGGGVWYYAVSNYNKPNKLAAVAPIAGFLNGSTNMKNLKNLADNNVPVWAFHNKRDNVIPMSRGKAPIDKLKSFRPKETPRFTVYNKSGHNSWTNAYQTNHSVHSPNVYEWLLAHKRGGGSQPSSSAKNAAPVADAGADQTIKLPKNYITLDGRDSKDEDGSIKKYTWSKVSGSSANIASASSSKTTVKSLKAGTYVFQLTVKDNDGATSSDKVTIKVNDKDAPDDVSTPVADGGSSGKNGLHYNYYEGDIRKVADFGKQKVKKSGTVNNFTLSPMQRKYYFGFEYTGYIKIAKAGTYTFYVTSDDGSALWIGSTKVVDNDGIHEKKEKSGKISLKAGMYPIKLNFFEHANGETLQVKYAGPGIGKKDVPNNVLFLDADDAVATSAPSSSSNSSGSASGDHGLRYKYYEGDQMDRISDVSKGKLKKKGTLSNFSIAPMQRKYYFGFEYEGYIKIDKAGTYTFSTTSDDGSALWIGSTKVVNNDRIQDETTRSGKISLKAGMYPIKVSFFEHANGETLEVKYEGPGISRRTIPNNVLYLGNTNAKTADTGKTFAAAEADAQANVLKDKFVEVNAYPNPVTDELHVNMSGTEGEAATISVIDQLGRVVYSEEKTLSGYADTFEVNVASLGLNPGIVFVQVNSPSNGKKTFKLLKQ